MKTKELICIPSPRYISEFEESLDKLPYDKYVVKYEPEPVAYRKIRDFFLNHNYETMILFADDLIVTKIELGMLLFHHKRNPQYVFSGICNFDMWNNRNKYCFRLVGDIGEYPKRDKLDEYLDKYKAKRAFSHICHVEFNAFACMVVSRKIIEEVEFRFDRPEGGGVDQNFCDDVRKRGYECLVDLDQKFVHLAGRENGRLENFFVGKIDPTESYIKEENRLLT